MHPLYAIRCPSVYNRKQSVSRKLNHDLAYDFYRAPDQIRHAQGQKDSGICYVDGGGCCAELSRDFSHHTEQYSTAKVSRERNPASYEDDHEFAPKWWVARIHRGWRLHGFCAFAEFNGVIDSCVGFHGYGCC